MRTRIVWTLPVLLCFSILGSLTADVDDEVCLRSDYEEGSLVIRLVRDKDGIWTTSVMTNDLLDDTANGTAVDINRKVFECTGQEVAVIKAVIAVPHKEKAKKDHLKFHPKGAKNLKVSNDGRTATRIDVKDEGNAGVLTDKPLANDQLFEVMLDEVIDLYTSSIGIGVSSFDPETSPYPTWMSAGTIMLYNNQIFEEAIVALQLYGNNLRVFQVGDRIGVMKKSNGDLHFYINGEDQGIAKTGVNYEVHGVIDLYANAVQASIV